MANIASQIKRNRQNKKRRLRNLDVRSELRTRIKSAIRAFETGSKDAEHRLRVATKRLDEAATAGVIHKNQAANRKSRLMRRVTQLRGTQAASTEKPSKKSTAKAEVKSDSKDTKAKSEK